MMSASPERSSVKTLRVEQDGISLDFQLAKRLADQLARAVVGEFVCLAWYDRLRDQAAPSNVNECHDQCEVPGWEEYAVNRGAELKVIVGPGDWTFLYRPLGEFSDA
jgi:hypothetical protein